MSTYIMLLLVCFVWGVIGYKIYLHLSPEDETIMPSFAKSKPIANDRDTFSLLLNYSDPFLKNYRHKVVSSAPKTGNSIPRTPRPKIEPVSYNWPDIRYKGMIQNKANSKTLAIVRMNQKQYNWEEGKTLSEIKLLKIYKDSIRVGINKLIKTIKKS